MTDVKLEDAELVAGSLDIIRLVLAMSGAKEQEMLKAAVLLRKIPELQQRISDLEQYIRERV